MDISGDYTFDAPQEQVWKALLDPNVLGSIMPGGKGFEQTGENQYSGMLEVKVGPVQGTFQGQVNLSDIIAPQSYQIAVDGKGSSGFVKGMGTMHLEARDSQTFMTYSGQAHVGGRIASVGQRLMDSAARSIIRQSLDALNDYLKIEVAKQPAPAVSEDATDEPVSATASPATTYKPPSQTALTLNVARDVTNDIIPPKYQPYLIGVVIGLILLLIWYLVTR